MNKQNKDNRKVPVAVLSCFLIAFILQGILKLCGVLVFEKALGWGIFNIIDRYKWLQIIYYSLFVTIVIYCLSFCMTSKPYSKKWYHYIIIVLTAVSVTTLREFVKLSIRLDILVDILAYIITPFIINITTNSDERLCKNDLFGIVTTLTLNIVFYLCHLGLQYWSAILNSIFPQHSMWLGSSSNLLIQLEVYIGLACIMLTTNELVKSIRRDNNMFEPMNIANEKAKLEAQKAHVGKKLEKSRAETTGLQERYDEIVKRLEEIGKKETTQQAK